MTNEVKGSDQRRRWIRRCLFGLALILCLPVGIIACLVPATAVLMGFELIGVRSTWLTPVVMFPFSILFYYVWIKTSLLLSAVLERITGVEDDLAAFLHQVDYIETESEDGYWIDRSGRIYKNEAALMRGADRFAKERAAK